MADSVRSIDGGSLAAAVAGSLAALLLVTMTVFDKQHPLYPGLIGLVVLSTVWRQARRIRALQEQVAKLSRDQLQPTT